MPVGLLEPMRGSNLSPMAKLPGGGQAEIGSDKVWNLARPEIDSGSYAYWSGRLGPRGAENWKEQQLASWKGEVAAYLSDQLLTGRPKDKPLSWDEVSGLVHHVAPGLAADRKFMSGIGQWAKMFNDDIAAQREAEAKRAANMYDSGKNLGAAYTPDQRALMNQHGYLVRGPQTSLAASPGLLDPQPATQPAGSPKRDLFAGYYPSPGQRKVDEIKATAQPEAWKAGLTSRAQQSEQTRGHAARRKFDQRNPSSTWVTSIDPRTGMQKKVWSGAQQEVDLGRKPFSVSDHKAQIMTKALTAAAQGQDPKTVLNPTELQILESAISSGAAIELLMELLGGKAGAQANNGGKQPSPAMQAAARPGITPKQGVAKSRMENQPPVPSPAMQVAAQPEEDEKPPLPGAFKGPDGSWCIYINGKLLRWRD